MTFRRRFEEIFDAQHSALQRFLVRLSGDPDLAADLTQETFVRLLRRGSVPDAPNAWLFTVALNLFRNARATVARRHSLLSRTRSRFALSDATPSPAEEMEADMDRRTVRAALDKILERDRNLLLLRAEGLSYRELAQALGLNEASVGTLLARAKRSFQEAYEEDSHAPR